MDCDNPPSSSSTNSFSRQEAKSSSVKVYNSYSSTNDDPTKPFKPCRRGSKVVKTSTLTKETDTEEAPEEGDVVITLDDEILVCTSNIKTVADYANAYEDIGILVPNSEIQLVPIKLKRGEDQSTGQQRYLQPFVKGRKTKC